MKTSFFFILLIALSIAEQALGQAPGTKLWEVVTPAEVLSSPAVADDGSIYVGCGKTDSGGWLCSFSPQGTTNWMLNCSAAVMASPGIGIDGRIYAGCYNGKVKIVSPTGSFSEVATGGRIIASPAIGSDGTVYFASISNWFHKVFALTPDGEIKWVFNLRAVPFSAQQSLQSSSPAIGPDGTIYVGSLDGNLYAITPGGQTNWVFPLRAITTTNTSPTYASPAIGSDGTIYIGADNGIFYAIDPKGFARWRVQAAGEFIESSAAVSIDGTIYFGSGSGQVHALAASGTRKWSFQSGGISASPAVAMDGSIYIGSYSGTYFYALSPFGTNLWKFPVPTTVFSSAAIGPSGTIYFGAGSKLYAFYGTNVPMNSAWPMFRGNARRTARSIQRGISNPNILADRTFALDVNVETGRTYQVECSTNLLHWAELTNFVSATLTNRVIDTTATNWPQRFYRLSTTLP